MMTDDELARFCGIAHVSPETRAKIIARITPAERQLYEEMAQDERLLKMGINPPGAIVCRRR